MSYPVLFIFECSLLQIKANSANNAVNCAGASCTALADLGTCCIANTGFKITGSTGTFAVKAASETVCTGLTSPKKFCPSSATANGGTCQAACSLCTGYELNTGGTCLINQICSAGAAAACASINAVVSSTRLYIIFAQHISFLFWFCVSVE